MSHHYPSQTDICGNSSGTAQPQTHLQQAPSFITQVFKSLQSRTPIANDNARNSSARCDLKHNSLFLIWNNSKDIRLRARVCVCVCRNSAPLDSQSLLKNSSVMGVQGVCVVVVVVVVGVGGVIIFKFQFNNYASLWTSMVVYSKH